MNQTDTINNLQTSVNNLAGIVNSNINQTVDKMSVIVDTFKQDIDIRVTHTETRLVQYTGYLILDTYYHIDRAYFHASPALIAIVVGIFKVVSTVISIVKTILSSQLVKVLFSIHKIVYELFPKYRDAVNKVLTKISDVSKQIGFGIDGVGHLINACAGGLALVSGLKREDSTTGLARMYEEYSKASSSIVGDLNELSKDPGKYISGLVAQRQSVVQAEVFQWWEDVNRTLEGVSETAGKAVEGLSSVVQDFSDFANSMPDFIKENIPQAVWDGIDRADSLINNTLLPAIGTLNSKLQATNAVIDSLRVKADGLVDKMSRPGDILLGVDDLPDYAKNNQLIAIDDVSSRKFQEQVNGESAEIDTEVQQLKSVYEAMTAPTPQPEFLESEMPARHEILGIVEEPRETWFIGGFDSPY